MSSKQQPGLMLTADFWLARHGQSEANQAGRCSGQLDVPLTPLGLMQAGALAERISAESIGLVVSSPLRRAHQTASIVAQRLGVTLEIEPGFAEIDFGAMQGRYRDHRDPEAQLWWDGWKRSHGAVPAPGGESFAELLGRVRPALERWLSRRLGAGLLIVGHRNVNRAVIGIVTGEPPAVLLRRQVSQNKLVRVESQGTGTVREERFFRIPT